ncbi:MAG: hypothetical protein ACRDZ2_12540, partial [Ilumatobacteraceae bacterium]
MAVASAAMIAVVAGCDGGGGDGLSAEERPYYEAMVEQFQTETNDELELDRSQAECVSRGWMAAIGVERFEAAGLTPDELRAQPEPEVAELDLDGGTAGEMYDAFGECDVEIADRVIRALYGERVTDEGVDCLRGELDDALLRDFVVTSFVESSSAPLQDEDVVAQFEAA